MEAEPAIKSKMKCSTWDFSDACKHFFKPNLGVPDPLNESSQITVFTLQSGRFFDVSSLQSNYGTTYFREQKIGLALLLSLYRKHLSVLYSGLCLSEKNLSPFIP